MITLRVQNGKDYKDYKADNFVKGSDYIIGFTKGQESVSFTSIGDFKNFKLLYGAKFESPDLTDLEKHIVQQAKKNNEMMDMIMELMMLVTMKGLR